MVSFRHSDRLPKCLHWYTSSPLKSLDAFLNLIKSNSSQKIRKFNVSVTQHPYFKPNTNFCVSNCYLCKFALLFFFLARFQSVFQSLRKILCFKSSFKNLNISSPGFTAARYSVCKFKRHSIIPV